MSFEQNKIDIPENRAAENLRILIEELKQEQEEKEKKKKKRKLPLYGNFWKNNTVYEQEVPKVRYWEFISFDKKELIEEWKHLATEFESLFTYWENNQDFFESSYSQKWPGSLFFYASKIPWETPLWQKIVSFNQTISRFWYPQYKINIDDEIIAKKIQVFLESLNESIQKKLEKWSWQALEQAFVPSYYGMMKEREQRKRSTSQTQNTLTDEEFLYNKEYLIMWAITRERSRFENAKFFTKHLPEEIRDKISFDFNTLWNRFDFVYKKYLEWIQYSENTVKNTQALFMYWKLINIEAFIEEKMNSFQSTNQSSERIIEQAKKDEFFWFFLNSDKKSVRNVWKTMILWWNKKRGRWLPFWNPSGDESIFYTSLIQFQFFWKNSWEVDGKVGKKTFYALKERVKSLSFLVSWLQNSH